MFPIRKWKRAALKGERVLAIKTLRAGIMKTGFQKAKEKVDRYMKINNIKPLGR